MKVFLDVGSNRGQTVGVLFEPTHGFARTFCRYGFDRIYCFEPAAELCDETAAKFRDARIVFHPYGLWRETCERPLYDPGTEGGSIFADKVNVDAGHSALCKFVRASDWFRENLSDADEVYVKLNCEGCEADIVEDLLDSGEYRKVTSLGLTFDVKKIPSQRHREEEVRSRLRERGYENFVDLNAIRRGGSRRQYIQRWLSAAGADRCSPAHRVRRAAYHCRTFAARAARYARRRLKNG